MRLAASNDPAVSVLMAVRNGEAFLREAIESILVQSFEDFEFIIVDDGSRDSSAEIIESFADTRIRLLRNVENQGLPMSLNRGLEAARGEFIARMDADDIALQNRLKVQFAYMREHPAVGACGAARIVRKGGEERLHNTQTADRIKYEFLLGNPLAHPTVILRKSALVAHGLKYNPDYRYAQDYDLWARMQEVCDVANISVPVLIYREHAAQASVSALRKQTLAAQRVRWRLFWRFLFDPACPARFKWRAAQEMLWERLVWALR